MDLVCHGDLGRGRVKGEGVEGEKGEAFYSALSHDNGRCLLSVCYLPSLLSAFQGRCKLRRGITERLGNLLQAAQRFEAGIAGGSDWLLEPRLPGIKALGKVTLEFPDL